MAEEIHDSVHAALAEMLDKARKEGHAEGYTKGYHAALAAMTECVRSLETNNITPPPANKPPMDLRLHKLGLPSRVLELLHRNDFRTVGDIYNRVDDLPEIRGMGSMSYNQLNEKLIALHYDELPRI